MQSESDSPIENPYVSSIQNAAVIHDSRRLRVTRLDPLAVAKISAVFNAIAALPAAFFIFMMSLLMAGLGGNIGGAQAAAPGILMAGFAIVVLPIFGGVMGFIVGAIGALIYNLASSLVGGIELDVEF